MVQLVDLELEPVLMVLDQQVAVAELAQVVEPVELEET